MQHNPRRGEIDISVAEPCSQLFSEDVCDDLHDKRRREQRQHSSPENEEGGLERLQKIVRNVHLEGLLSCYYVWLVARIAGQKFIRKEVKRDCKED